MLDRQQTIAELVLEHSECSAVFELHNIDFCCRGDLSIEAAANAKQLDPKALLDELTRAIESRTVTPSVDARSLPTKELCAHIISTHHEYTRTALRVVSPLAAKVFRVHGDRNPKLRELAETVEALATALLPHMDEEELELFPLLTAPTSDSTETRERLGAMKKEHLAVAALLERIRSASDGFTLPQWACASYRTLFSELEQLERDVHIHVHLENHVLEPRFVTPEEKRA